MNNPDPKRGILHSFILDRNGGGRPIDAEKVSIWAPDQGVLWIHVDLSNAATRPWLSAESSIDDIVMNALLQDETRPRAIAGDGGILVVLRGVNTNPENDPEDMVAIRIWLQKDRIISSRRRRLLSVQDIVNDLGRGEGPRSSGEALVMLIGKLANRIGDFVNTIEDRVAEIEDDEKSLSIEERRHELSLVRRQIASVRRFLSPQRDALDRLYRHPGEWFSDKEVQRLREEADRITRHLEDLDLARERAVVLAEEFLAVIAQEQNNRMYVLSVVAAVFLPLTFVTGLLGMNVGGLPGLENPRGFFAAALIMGLSSAAMIAFFRWKRWI